MDKVYVVSLPANKNRKERLHNVFDNEESAIRSVRELEVRAKRYGRVNGAYYQEFIPK